VSAPHRVQGTGVAHRLADDTLDIRRVEGTPPFHNACTFHQLVYSFVFVVSRIVERPFQFSLLTRNHLSRNVLCFLITQLHDNTIYPNCGST